MNDRKLATIRQISELRPIPNADLIELALVDGWQVVVKKNEYQEKDLCVYLEIDSWVPHSLAPFLSKGKEPAKYQGVAGERLKTIKLKGCVSQGLILPLNVLGNPEETFAINESSAGADVTEELGILKWEKEIPAQLQGKVKGSFPSFIPKTDQERIQNCITAIQYLDAQYWELTEKLDGSSMTVYRYNEQQGVCSRNLELSLEDTSNTFVATAMREGILDKLPSYGFNLAIQGELVGPGIQGNAYGLSQPKFYVYDIFDIDKQEYLLPEDRKNVCKVLCLDHVPTLAAFYTDEFTTVEELLIVADGSSILNPKTIREGFVFKNINSQDSFKVISNKWLLKND